MQRTGPGVISQSLPIEIDFFQRGGGQVGYGGETLHKPVKIGNDGFNGGLLKHQFRNQNNIWIGMGTAFDPPGQVAAVLIVPFKKLI